MSAPAAVAVPTTHVLRDGREVIVRPVQSGDAESFRAAFARLSAQSRYNRMMGSVRELLTAVAEKAVNPESGREVALVAVAQAPGDIVGGARYVVDGKDSCEFAVAIADDWQRVGLASALMTTLISCARTHGLQGMEGYVLSSNRGMLHLATRLGFETMPSTEGPTVRLVRLNLISR